MKKVLFTCAVIFVSLGAKAQIDLSINPIALLFSNFDLSAEYRASNDIGIELTPGISFNKYNLGDGDYKTTGYGVRLIGKYYFSPEDGCDKWSIGPYVKFAGSSLKNDANGHEATNTRLAVGFYSGYKWVSRKNIIFELGLGVGKAFVNKYSSNDENYDLGIFDTITDIDFTGKLAVGYRFGGSN